MKETTTSAFYNKPLRILVVEDSESDFELLQYRLRTLPQPVEAMRVEEEKGLAIALSQAPWDLVISDHRLPGFSSEEALDQVRAKDPDIPFLIVSGAIGEDIAVEAMRSGADDYLMKDNLKRLIPAIERSLRGANEKKAKRRALQEQRTSEDKLRNIATNIPGLIVQISFDPQTQTSGVPVVSEGVLHDFGLPAEAFSANPELLFDQFLSADSAHLKTLLYEAASAPANSEGSAVEWEGRLKTADGNHPRWMALMARRSNQTTQRHVLWDGVMLNISSQKRAEAERQESQDELRRVTEEFEQRREHERGSIAREIHDDIGGTLTKLKADIAWIKRKYGAETDMNERLLDMLELIDHTVLASQRIARDLRPGILDYGLVPALEWQMADFKKRTEKETTFTCNVEELELDGKISTAVFRVLQESLTNVLKYAQASKVCVELFVDEENITLEVQDDGIGIDPTDLKKKSSFGVRGMNERAQSLGGWLDINGTRGKGTTLMLCIPRK
ncbi:MAG: response regulator [Burkholderiales bacterium]|nr:response regulator [Burkholderiales bacterium]